MRRHSGQTLEEELPVVLPLLKGDAGIGLQILQRQSAAPGQRVGSGNIHRRRHLYQLRELQLQLTEQAPQVALIVLVQRQHAYFAAQLAHILQHLVGGGFPKMEAVPLPGKALHQLGEGSHGEIEVLAGHGEALFALAAAAEALLHQLRLGEKLPRVAQKLLPLPRHHNATIGAGEYGYAHLRLQLPYGGGEAGLGDEQLFGGGADGAALRCSDGVF